MKMSNMMEMNKTFGSVLTEFLAENGKKILGQPDQFKGLFLDFSQNSYRSETLIFSQFLASQFFKEILSMQNINEHELLIIASRFQQTSFIDKNVCVAIVFCAAYFRGIISREMFVRRVPTGPFSLNGGKQADQSITLDIPKPTLPPVFTNTPASIAPTPAATIANVPDFKLLPVTASKTKRRKNVLIAAAIIVPVVLVVVLVANSAHGNSSTNVQTSVSVDPDTPVPATVQPQTDMSEGNSDQSFPVFIFSDTPVSSIVQTRTRTSSPAPAPKVVEPKTAAPKATAPKIPNNFWVQAATFSTMARAENAKDILASKGIFALIEKRDVESKNFFRVRVGPYASQKEANYWNELIRGFNGFEGSMVLQSPAQ